MAFCPSCGAAQDLARPVALEGDIRLATVLFGDVVGFTALSEHLSPEEVTTVMNQCFEVLSAPIVRLEGTIDKYVGDAIMARFGAPQAHEDDAVRAISAALEMQRSMRIFAGQMQAAGRPGLNMRIGINTGEVLAGEVGSSALKQFTLMGNTVNLASRLEHEAEPGSVLVGETTYRLARHAFDFRALPPMEIRGQSELIHAFVPTGPGAGRPMPEEPTAPMVGRQEELARLQAWMDGVGDGHGCVIELVGEPGVGKSRLLAEFKGRSERTAWVQASAPTFGQTAPYSLLSAFLRDLVLDEDDEQAPGRDALRDRLLVLLPEGSVSVAVAVIGEILGIEGSGPADISATDTRVRRAMLIRILRELVAARSHEAVLAIALEDIHWADSASLDVLGRVFADVESRRVLVVITCRPGFELSWKGPPAAHRIALQDLPADSTRDLTAAVLGTSAIAPDVSRLVLERSGGNPYFLEQIISTLIESAALIRQGGVWAFRPGVDASRIPETLQGVVQARIDRLPRPARALLETAAVIGMHVPRAVLSDVLEDEDSDGQVDLLIQQQFVVARGGSAQPGLEFKHSLTRDVVYRGILSSRRQALHGRVAAALEARGDSSAEALSLLAAHYAEAADRAKAVEYAIAAGDRARMLHANEDAARYFEQAVELLAGESGEDGATRLRVLESLGDARVALGNAERAREAYLQAQGLQPAPRDRARLWRKLGSFAASRGQYVEAASDYRRAEEAIEGAGEPGEQVQVWLARAAMERSRGALDNAWATLVQSLALVRELDEATQADLFSELGSMERDRAHLRSAMGYLESAAEYWRRSGTLDRQALVSAALADIAFHEGHLEVSAAHLQDALEVRQRMLDRHGIATALLALARVRWAMGDFPEAEEVTSRASALALEMEDDVLIADSKLQLGLMALERDRVADAGEMVTEAYRLYRSIRNWRGLAQALLARAAVAQREDDIERARGSLKTAEALVAEMHDPFLRAETQIAAAELEERANEVGRASERGQVALTAAREAGDPRLAALAEQLLGRLYARRGQPGAGKRLLLSSVTTLRGMGACVQSARTLLDYLDVERNGQEGIPPELQAHVAAAREGLQRAGLVRELARLDALLTSTLATERAGDR
jgi:adenylate cyclase